jgi:hypothetical protein
LLFYIAVLYRRAERETLRGRKIWKIKAFPAESPLSCFEEWGTLRVGRVVDKRTESSIAEPKERLCEEGKYVK